MPGTVHKFRIIELCMTFKQHTSFSALLSSLLFLIFQSWGLSIACLVSGIFIDLDYGIDYIRQYGLPLTVQKFLHAYRNDTLHKVRLFHGWEWLVFWLFVSWLTDWNPWVVGVLIGFGQHIFLDTINMGESFLSYSLIWRWKNKVKPLNQKDCPDDENKKAEKICSS